MAKVLIEQNTLDSAISDFDSIQQAIINKGVAIPTGTPTNQYADKINQITTGDGEIIDCDGWHRPTDRPTKPTMVDNTILMLFGASELSPNDIAFLCTTSAGQYKVDWGDGTSDLYNSNVKAEHSYDFTTISKTVDSQGYKMVWITVTPVSGNILSFNVNQKHSLRIGSYFIPQVFEMYIQCPNMTGLTFPSSNIMYGLLEVFSLDTNAISSTFSYCLANCFNLKKIEKLLLPSMGNTSGMSYFMYNCYSYNAPFPDDTYLRVLGSYFMNNCYSFNQSMPFLLGVSSVGIAGNFMQNCYGFNQKFPESLAIRGGVYFLNGCRSFNHSVTVDLSLTTAVGTNFIGTGNYAQKGLRLLNMHTAHNAITISNSNLDVDALVLLFGDLTNRTATTAGTITITNCYGADKLTTEQRAIATNKNWSIVG